MPELTVFIKVKIDNLKEFSKLIPEIVRSDDKTSNDNIKINTVIKYLLILLVSNFVPENSNLLTNIFNGFACEASSFIENFNSEYILTSLMPELVEKKDPPIIVIIKKIKVEF